MGLITTFKVFGPLALKRPGSRFIAISSFLNAEHGMKLRAAYSGAKAGVSGFCRALAVEWGPLGATVNSIAPRANRDAANAWLHGPVPRALRLRA